MQPAIFITKDVKKKAGKEDKKHKKEKEEEKKRKEKKKNAYHPPRPSNRPRRPQPLQSGLLYRKLRLEFLPDLSDAVAGAVSVRAGR